MSQHSEDASLNPFEDETSFSLSAWTKEFFQHYWPLVFFVTLFLLMMALCLIIMGGPTLSIAGLAIVAVFGIALTLTFIAPILLAPFLLLVALTIFIAYPEFSYNTSRTALLGIGLFGLFIAGSLYFLAKIRTNRKEDEAEPYTKQVNVANAEQPVQTVEKPAEAAPAKQKGPKPVAFDKAVAAKGVTLIFGTESGNAEGLAEVAKSGLEADGHPVQILDAGVVDYRHLKAFANLLIITSTWGEGDPPSNAIELVGDMKNTSLTHDVGGIQFSVCSLGDTNYEQFCKCGKDFDEYLEAKGGKRFFKRVDCDVDYEQPFEEWLLGVRNGLKAGLNTVPEYEEPVVASDTQDEVATMGEAANTPQPVEA